MITQFLAMGTSGSGGGGGIGALLPMVLIFVVFYFLILRPQSRKQKAHQQMLQTLSKGDKVVTTGGIHGKIVKVNESEGTIIVKVSDDLKLTLDSGSVTRKIGVPSKT